MPSITLPNISQSQDNQQFLTGRGLPQGNPYIDDNSSFILLDFWITVVVFRFSFCYDCGKDILMIGGGNIIE